MRTFVITKNGVARIMRTYALAPSGRVLADGDAPDAADEIAKWHTDDQAQVTSIREIAEADIPSDPAFKDAWRDGGAAIDTDMQAAREIHAARIADRQTQEIVRLKRDETHARLAGRAADASKHAGDRAAVEAINLTAEGARIANAQTPTALSAVWPIGLKR